MSKRFIRYFGPIVAGLVLAISLIGCAGGCFDKDEPTDTVDLHITNAQFNTANFKQYASYMELGIHDGTLYMWDEMSSKLSRFENGKFQKIFAIDGSGIGFCNGYFYYQTLKNQETYEYSIHSYRLGQGDHTILTTIDIGSFRDTYFLENGKICVPVEGDSSYYITIENAQVIDQTLQPEIYSFGAWEYVREGELSHINIVRYDADGNTYSYVEELPYGKKSMIPCDNGLLIHNETNGDFLYFIEAESGDVIELFTVDCIYAVSAVNVHDGYAYLSFVRYTKYGPLGIGGKQDENDELNGTYRISLTDYSVEKISDESYNGLFIFDDTGIYACNEEGSIYKLDFDGQRITTVLEH